uniref:Uncharacterized protein n=1 Tax=Pristionchus pacificus TaxID=54126 RepID=A0A2A6B9B5_PRIPA|eukprot:PDM62453.1 hypothetical protein PRIPAC_51895 [Pristionchus pacificus]
MVCNKIKHIRIRSCPKTWLCKGDLLNSCGFPLQKKRRAQMTTLSVWCGNAAGIVFLAPFSLSSPLNSSPFFFPAEFNRLSCQSIMHQEVLYGSAPGLVSAFIVSWVSKITKRQKKGSMRSYHG